MVAPKVISYNNGSLTQSSNANALSTSLSVTFDDQRAADILTYSFEPVGSNLGLLSAISSNNSGAGNIGFVTYQYTVPNASVQYLAAGQTLTETFKVKATSTSSDLIKNGDFSAQIASTNDVPGWVVNNGQSPNGSFVQGSFVVTYNGNPSLVLGAAGTGGGDVSQHFYGVAGTQYRLSFDFGTFGADEKQQVGVRVTDSSGNGVLNEIQLFDSTGSQNPTAESDAHQEFNFTVNTTGTYTLTFVNRMGPWAGSSADAVIDNVTLQSLNTTQTAAVAEVIQDVTVTITEINDAPVLSAPGAAFSATEDTSSTYAQSTFTTSATDADTNAVLKVASVTPVIGGTPVLNADGTVTFTPSANFNGPAKFSFKVTDGTSTSDSAEVTVNVAAVNDAPVAVADNLNASRNTAVTYTAAQLLGNDIDVENQALEIKTVSSGTGGTAVLNADGTVTFTPAANFTGPANFTYVAAETTSPNVQSAAATVTVNVNPPAINTAPVVSNLARLSVNEGDTTPISINLLDGAVDNEGDVLTVSGLKIIVNDNDAASLPAGMSLSGNTLRFDPSNVAFNSLKQGQALDIRLNYNVVDGRGGVTAQSQSIVINGTNDNPVVGTPLTSSTNKGSNAYTLNLLTGASDPDAGDNIYVTNLTYAINGGAPTNATPPGVSLSGNILTVNPKDAGFNTLYAGQAQTITLAYRVQDSFGGFTNQTETITIAGAGSAPNLAPTVTYLDESRTTEGADSYVLDLLRGANDAEGAALSVTGLRFRVGDSSSSTSTLSGLSLSNTGLLTVSPKDASFDTISSGSTRAILLNYLVSDGVSSTAQSQSIVISGTNDQPTVAAALSSTNTKGDAAYTVNLLEGANDIDAGNNLYLANVTYKVDGTAINNTPAGLSISGNKLTINPSDAGFNNLYTGQSKVITVTYQVKDSFGAFV